MAFNYIPSGKLDGSTEQLLEKIDNFPYNRLKPYSKLGDIHAQLTVEVVDDIPVRKRTIILTLGELKKQLEETKKRNEEIRKIREDELQKNLEDEKDEMKWREAMSMREFLPNEISTMNLEEVLNKHSDDPDTTEVSLPINERIDGYYTRDHNNKGLIVLANRGRSEQTIAMTYVHELMHAYYDCGCNGSMNDIEYVEEPFAELGMLRFMEQFNILFLYCYLSVKKKQNSIGFVHYGFGAELFDCYTDDIFPEECMMKSHTFDKNALGSLTRYYQEIQDILKLSWPNYIDRHTVAQNILILLMNDANYRLYKPYTSDSNIWYPYVFLFRRKVCTKPKKNWKNIKPGERVKYQGTGEWITEQSGIFIDYSSFEGEVWCGWNSALYSFYGIITKVRARYCEMECYILPNVHIDMLFLNNDFLAVNIPASCDYIHFDNFDIHNHLQISVDSNNKSFEIDSKNHMLIDKRNNNTVCIFSDSPIPDGVTEIDGWTFKECTGLTSIMLPDGFTEIGWRAYENCRGLTSIVIPNRVTKIGCGAFYGCTGLTSINIPDSVTEIGDEAFSGCTSLTSINIPDSVTQIGRSAFKDCPNLQEAFSHICSNNGKRLLYVPKNITEFNIPDGVTEIGGYAFEGCKGLKSIVVPNGVTEIGDYAFAGFTGLTSITIPDSVTEIGSFAFEGCTSLASIVIPNSVVKIGESAFDGCTSLTSIVISDSVTEIGGSAFEGCTGLTSITIPDSVTEIEWSTFEGCTSLTSINLPDNVTEIGWSAFKGCTGLTSITIPDSVTEIRSSAFWGCTGLASINIPDSVTEIGWSAFEGCTSLTSIVIPDSITEIGEDAFANCTNLVNVSIPGHLTADDLLRAFKGYESLNVTIRDNNNENSTTKNK